MKASDFITRRLARWGLDTCFTVTGGGAMHLNDSFGADPSYNTSRPAQWLPTVMREYPVGPQS